MIKNDESVKNILISVFKALNNITVRGQSDLNTLAASINTIEALIARFEKIDKETNE